MTLEEKAEQIRNRYRAAGNRSFWSHAANALYQSAQDRTRISDKEVPAKDTEGTNRDRT